MNEITDRPLNPDSAKAQISPEVLMLRRSAAILVMTTALAAGAAVAQTSTAPGSTAPMNTSPATPPDATPPAATSPSPAPAATPAPSASQASAASAAGSMKFVTDQSTGEYRSSKFVGLDVYGADNAKIGDISELLMDKEGSVKAAVIGVGGFLGIGEKNVAVPFSELKLVDTKVPSSTTAGATSSTMSTASTSPPTTTATAPARSPEEEAAYNGYPDHVVLSMSKADLQNAPAFKYYSSTHSSTGGTSNATPPKK